MKPLLMTVGTLLLFVSPPAFSDPTSPAKTTEKPMDKILDFEGDVIEGERDRPDVFVQLGANPTAESILFIRKDFNDFHKASRRSRPSFIEAPLNNNSRRSKGGKRP